MSDPESISSPSLADALRKARQTRRVEIGFGALRATAGVFCEQFGARPAVIIADAATFDVAGRAVAAVFAAAGHAMEETVVFRDPDLYAEFRFVERLETLLRTDGDRHDQRSGEARGAPGGAALYECGHGGIDGWLHGVRRVDYL